MDPSRRQIHEKIQILKAAAEELAAAGEDLPAVVRNSARILASVKMLELNLSDVLAMDPDGS